MEKRTVRTVREIATISPFNPLVDLSRPPKMKRGFWAIDHTAGNLWEYNSHQIRTFQTLGQLDHGASGSSIVTEIGAKGINANLIDWYLEHTLLIPEYFFFFKFGVFVTQTVFVCRGDQRKYIKGLRKSDDQGNKIIAVYKPLEEFFFSDAAFLIKRF